MGAKLHGGRWNSKGIPLLYTSSSRALAALEVLVHVPASIPMLDFVLVTLELPEDSMEEIRLSTIKDEMERHGWKAGFAAIGDAWYKKQRSLLLKVPSMVIPDEYNYLVNPAHPKASKIRIREIKVFGFDERLLK